MIMKVMIRKTKLAAVLEREPFTAALEVRTLWNRWKVWHDLCLVDGKRLRDVECMTV